MPATDDFFQVPNPNYNGQAFRDERRTQAIIDGKGVFGSWSPLERSGEWKVRTFLFDPAHWGTADACRQWVSDNKQAFASAALPVQSVQCFEVAFTEQQPVEDQPDPTIPGETDFALIQQYALDKTLTPADYYVRTMRLTNDQWSSSGAIKLSRGFQQSLMDSASGKSLLLGHAAFRGFPAVPEGMFYKGETRYDETTGVEWGLAKFFMPRTSQNEHSRMMIDSGAWKHVSVGLVHDVTLCSICGKNLFDAEACKHVPGESYPESELASAEMDCPRDPQNPDRVLCGMDLRGKGTMLEGSIVYLPELNGTQITAMSTALSRGDLGGAKRLLLSGEGDAQDTGAEPATKAEQVQPGTDLGHADTQTPEKAGDHNMDTPEQITALEAQIAEKDTALATLTEQATATQAALAAAAADATALRGAISADVGRLASLLQRDAEFGVFKTAFGEDLANMPAGKLLELQAQWQALADQQYTGGRQSTPTDRDNATGEPPKPAETVTVPASAI